MGQMIARTKDRERFKQGLGNGDFETGKQAIRAAVVALKEQYGFGAAPTGGLTKRKSGVKMNVMR